eukprot:TRINITY_DN12745_c0_g1_i1.p1 TRINITY_DN12745_c0_g1~~TRINITY_DN12745_c0_g1_i1.p1  ORF type:complete len:455 (+),score=83.37 TRINITY_DN12745_c0_g1_i1:90-1454(+)
METFGHVYTPLLICCYSIIGVLSVYQLYLMKRHLYNLLSFNTGFLCCCVPWCILRIAYWLVPANACADDTHQLLQEFMLELPINLQFVCFYLIMVYIMRQVRNSEGTWDREFRGWLKWISLLAHVSFLGCNVGTAVIQVTKGSRFYPPYHDDDAECNYSYERHPEDCHKYGCFAPENTATNLQLGFSSCAFLLLALSLLFYGTKLHINANDAKNPRPITNRSIADHTESIPQIAFGAGESPMVTEGVCIALLIVFVSRSIFDALQLDMFAAAPLSIPQDKDITDFWIFFVYVCWEVLPISLMLFFFGSTKHAPKHTSHEKRFQAYAQPMREDEEDPTLDQPTEPARANNIFWPMSNPQLSTSFVEPGNQRPPPPAHYALSRKEQTSFMDNENRYDSQPGTPQQFPLNAPGSTPTLPVQEENATMPPVQQAALPQGRMGDRAYLYNASQLATGLR